MEEFLHQLISSLHPRNLTWKLKISPWKRKVLLPPPRLLLLPPAPVARLVPPTPASELSQTNDKNAEFELTSDWPFTREANTDQSENTKKKRLESQAKLRSPAKGLKFSEFIYQKDLVCQNSLQKIGMLLLNIANVSGLCLCSFRGI